MARQDIPKRGWRQAGQTIDDVATMNDIVSSQLAEQNPAMFGGMGFVAGAVKDIVDTYKAKGPWRGTADVLAFDPMDAGAPLREAGEAWNTFKQYPHPLTGLAAGLGTLNVPLSYWPITSGAKMAVRAVEKDAAKVGIRAAEAAAARAAARAAIK